MPKITIPASNIGEFNAYVALPDACPAPAVIVIQEIFGVNQELRDKCDALAERGYLAVCPDLFWRIEPGIELVDSDEAQLQRAFELFGQFDIDAGIDDLKATISHLRSYDACNGVVGCVGYCLGGKLAYKMAADSDINASVGYYGVGIEDMLDQASDVKKPLMLHVAEFDEFVPKEAQEQIKLTLMPNRLITVHSYPGAQHAFARGQGNNFHPEAANLANERTIEFLEAHIKSIDT